MLIVVLLFVDCHLMSQTSVSIGEQLRCENSSVLIPVVASNFDDVAAFTFFIKIDTLMISFVSIENFNSQLPGGVIYNFNEQASSIGITWASLTGISIEYDTLFSLKMMYHSGHASLIFDDASEVVNSIGVVIDVIYEDGMAVKAIQFSVNAQSMTVTEGEQAQFSVEMLYAGDHLFQWQKSTGEGWTDIIEEPPFSGNDAAVLIIDEVPLSFNNLALRCVVTYDDCSEISDSALLTVSPLTIVSKVGNQQALLSVFPNPANDQLNFSVRENDALLKIVLINLPGEVLFENQIENLTGNFFVKDIAPGIYFLQLISNNNCLETVKVLKR